MRQSRTAELLVGLFMLAGLVALFFLSMKVSNLGTLDTGNAYRISARFDNIGGLKVRAPVTMAGVRIGKVSEIGFDPRTFEAVVTLSINERYNGIPADTFAKILTQGLLGEQYVGLDPGGSPNPLENGGEIHMTQSALVLEEIVGQFLFSKAEEAGKL